MQAASPRGNWKIRGGEGMSSNEGPSADMVTMMPFKILANAIVKIYEC